MNTEEFTKIAKDIHGDKYDYSQVVYRNNHTKVEIVCPIHGIFLQTPIMHTRRKQGCPICGGTKRLTAEEFCRKARCVHGDKFDYSKVDYRNSKTKVVITCPKHGDFLISPNMHLRGNGCPKCANEKKRGMVYGIGYYDSDFSMTRDDFTYEAYLQWAAMLGRCYSTYRHKLQKTYSDCKVCEEWHSFSCFFEWYKQNYRKGYMLDKDILIKGNKIYSPTTCCFVPNDINIIFSWKRKPRALPIGVSWNKTKTKYVARLNCEHGQIHIGTFNTPEEAFVAYKREKEAYIKEVANKWKDKIEQKVYEAMMKYEVEITD